MCARADPTHQQSQVCLPLSCNAYRPYYSSSHHLPPSSALKTLISPLLPLDRFQSRIEPFVTVERELWRLFIFSPFCNDLHLRSRDSRSICPLATDRSTASLSDYGDNFPLIIRLIRSREGSCHVSPSNKYDTYLRRL